MTRIALVSDFLEDGWYSMDLVAEMLLTHLPAQSEKGCKATLIRPTMKRRMGALPVLGSYNLARKADQAWNRFLDYPRLLRSLRSAVLPMLPVLRSGLPDQQTYRRRLWHRLVD